MSRFLLLLVFFAWMSWTSRVGEAPVHALNSADLIQPAWFLAGYLFLVLATAGWSRHLASRVDHQNFSVSLKRFNFAMTVARMLVPAWFFFGVVFLNWGNLIWSILGRAHLHPERFDTLGIALGCLPAFLAWMGLWWSQYPADICFREQSLLIQLDAGMPIHRPPTLRSYLLVNLRLQLLFTMIPVLALVSMRDLLSLALTPLGLSEQNSQVIELGLSLVTAALILLVAPELLRRVLQTEPMPPSPLRQRLEEICRRHRIRYKGILLWRTDHNMGNAAVMGIIPQTRYILMSDLLLETMSDEQIEAVFAHEIGHIIHRHMLWFAVFFGALMFALVGLSGPLQSVVDRLTDQADWLAAVGTMFGSIAALSLFLFLSRKFERQADVFAARSIDPPPEKDSHVEGNSHVGQRGALVFSSALHQVARINCIPITAWSWCHGSIAKRMDYLQGLSDKPELTAEFDRFMSRLYAALMVSLLGFGVWAMATLITQSAH